MHVRACTRLLQAGKAKPPAGRQAEHSNKLPAATCSGSPRWEGDRHLMESEGCETAGGGVGDGSAQACVGEGKKTEGWRGESHL